MRVAKLYLIFVFVISIFSNYSKSHAQINTEALRKRNLKQGLTLISGLNYQIAKGNTEFIIYNAQLRLDYFKKSYHFFMISNLKYGEMRNDQFLNKGFIHSRVVFSSNRRFMPELFVQVEYNDFIKLRQRNLIGSGMRFGIIEKSNRFLTYLGMGFMGEQENFTDPAEGKKKLLRSTNYFSLKYKLNELVDYFLICYYQVDIRKFSDYRILGDSGFRIALFKTISLIVDIDYRYDNQPFPGIKRYDLSVINGFEIQF